VINVRLICRLRVASHDPEERESLDYTEQIGEVLVKQFYMSGSDIAFCRNFDGTSLSHESGYPAMVSLHEALKAAHPDEDEVDTVA
jgi:hypothetical protein